MSYQIAIPKEAAAVIERVGTPRYLLEGMAKALAFQNQLTLSHIIEKRLTGKGPFPVEQHRLGERSKLYRKSVRTSAPEIAAASVSASIGANAAYAGIHETGGTFTRTTKPGKVRLRTDASGALLGQRTNPRLAVFARKTHKRAREVQTLGGRTYTIKLPARAPMTTGFEDRLPAYGPALGEGIIEAWRENS